MDGSSGTLVGGTLVFPPACKALLKFKLDMNVLMAVAVIGEHAEAAVEWIAKAS
jgi:hypothetical protein